MVPHTEMPEMNLDQSTIESMSSEPVNSPDIEAGGHGVGADAQVDQTDSTEETSGEKTIEMLGHFPPEIATLLIIAGVAGVLLPGPVGAPLLIAGGVMMWPKTFRPIELWFSRKFPATHREGVIQLKEFIRDLNQRYPDTKKQSDSQ